MNSNRLARVSESVECGARVERVQGRFPDGSLVWADLIVPQMVHKVTYEPVRPEGQR